MRILKILILLFILACLSVVGDRINKKNVTVNNLTATDTKALLTSQLNKNVRTNYKINVEYNKARHRFIVDETITWKNIDSVQIDLLYLNIPKRIKVSEEEYSTSISTFEINGKSVDYELVLFEDREFVDSSLISIRIPNGLKRDERVEIKVQFDIVLSKESSLSDAQFYNFENWYVTISPFIAGEFKSFPTHNYIKTFLEYSNFNVAITIPEEYNVAIPGDYKIESYDGIKVYTASAKNVSRFNWFLFNELTKYSEETIVNSNKITLNIFIQDGKENYVERYVDGVTKYLEALSSFGKYPFKQLTIVDIPNFGQIGNKSYPNLIALNTDLISPTKTQKFEYQLALVIAEQYYGCLITSNNIKEAWLSKGLSSFVAEKLVRAHYGDLYSYFNIADYYPIGGIRFMSYAGIPLIYIVSDQVIPEGGRYLNEYYNNLTYTDLSIPSYMLPNNKAYHVASVVKPQIALLTLEKMMGEGIFKSRLKEYTEKSMFQYPTALDFNNSMTKNSSKSEREFYNVLFRSDKTFDYAIKSVEKVEGDEYEILVERIESGVTPIVLSVITETDTINIKWDGIDRFKVFSINSTAEVISAELDSENKNLLDLNFANNSYVVEEQYWGSISYATRVFFWFQNALMLIGGKG